MLRPSALIEELESGAWDSTLAYLYGAHQVPSQKARYVKAVEQFTERFGEEHQVKVISCPGRTEVGGNHTDHQRGRVLAASVNLDVIAVAAKIPEQVINIQSEGFSPDSVSLTVTEPQEEEINHAASLIRGIAVRFLEKNYQVGGLVAYTTSDVPPGSGLSSSAAFEGLVGGILSVLYNGEKILPLEIAKIGQWAENNFFMKPCGLMDQTACAVGGFVSIDFLEKESPVVDQVDFDFARSGFSLCIVDTKGKHADLTDDYAAMPAEMKSVAAYFGKEVLREVPFEDFLNALSKMRGTVSDRALVRAMHFYADNDRVPLEVAALRRGDFDAFRQLIVDSGRSSAIYLQNLYSTSNPAEQGLTLALSVSELILRGKGAWRVHGGGVAGTIQAFVPNAIIERYTDAMNRLFGEGSAHQLSIRPVGVCEVCTDLQTRIKDRKKGNL